MPDFVRLNAGEDINSVRGRINELENKKSTLNLSFMESVELDNLRKKEKELLFHSPENQQEALNKYAINTEEYEKPIQDKVTPYGNTYDDLYYEDAMKKSDSFFNRKNYTDRYEGANIGVEAYVSEQENRDMLKTKYNIDYDLQDNGIDAIKEYFSIYDIKEDNSNIKTDFIMVGGTPVPIVSGSVKSKYTKRPTTDEEFEKKIDLFQAVFETYDETDPKYKIWENRYNLTEQDMDKLMGQAAFNQIELTKKTYGYGSESLSSKIFGDVFPDMKDDKEAKYDNMERDITSVLDSYADEILPLAQNYINGLGDEEKKTILNATEQLSQISTPYYNEYKDTDKLSFSEEDKLELAAKFLSWKEIGGDEFAVKKLKDFYTDTLESNQSKLEVLSNGVASFVDYFAGEVISLAGIIYGLGYGAFKANEEYDEGEESNDPLVRYFSGVVNNPVTRYGNDLASTQAWDWKEQNRLKSLGIQDNTYLGGEESLGRMMYDVTTNFGFTAGSMVLSWGLGAASKVVLKGIGAMERNITAKVIKNSGKSLMSGRQVLSNLNKSLIVRQDIANVFNVGLVGSAEGAMEGLNTRDDVMSTGEAQLNRMFSDKITKKFIDLYNDTTPQSFRQLIEGAYGQALTEEEYNAIISALNSPVVGDRDSVIMELLKNENLKNLVVTEDDLKQYNDDLNELKRNADLAMVVDFGVNSLINGMINATYKATLHTPAIQRSLGKFKSFIGYEKPDNAFRNIKFTVGKNPFSAVASVEDIGTAKLIWDGFKFKSKESFGEFLEEYEQNVASTFSSSLANSYMNEYLLNKYGESVKYGISDSSTALSNALNETYGQLFSKEAITEGIYGGLSTFIGGISPNFNYKKGSWKKTEATGIGGKTLDFIDNLYNNSPVQWRSAIFDAITAAAPRNRQAQRKADEKTAEAFNNLFSGDKAENLMSISTLTKLSGDMKEAVLNNDSFSAQNNKAMHTIHALFMLQRLKGTDFYDGIMRCLEERSKLTEDAISKMSEEEIENAIKNTDAVSEFASPEYRNEQEELKELEPLQQKVEMLKKIGSDAGKVSKMMSEIQKATSDIEKLFGKDLNQDIKEGLIAERLMGQNAKERYEELEKEINPNAKSINEENQGNRKTPVHNRDFKHVKAIHGKWENIKNAYDRAVEIHANIIQKKNDARKEWKEAKESLKKAKGKEAKKQSNAKVNEAYRKYLAASAEYEFIDEKYDELSSDYYKYKDEITTTDSDGNEKISDIDVVLSAEDIRNLDAEVRSEMIRNRNEKGLYSNNQRKEIAKFLSNGGDTIDPVFEKKVIDAGALKSAYKESVKFQEEVTRDNNTDLLGRYVEGVKEKFANRLLNYKNSYLNDIENYEEFSKELDRKMASSDDAEKASMNRVLNHGNSINWQRYKKDNELLSKERELLGKSATYRNEVSESKGRIVQLMSSFIAHEMGKGFLSDDIGIYKIFNDYATAYTQEFIDYVEARNSSVEGEDKVNYEDFSPEDMYEFVMNIKKDLENIADINNRINSSNERIATQENTETDSNEDIPEENNQESDAKKNVREHLYSIVGSKFEGLDILDDIKKFIDTIVDDLIYGNTGTSVIENEELKDKLLDNLQTILTDYNVEDKSSQEVISDILRKLEESQVLDKNLLDWLYSKYAASEIEDVNKVRIDEDANQVANYNSEIVSTANVWHFDNWNAFYNEFEIDKFINNFISKKSKKSRLLHSAKQKTKQEEIVFIHLDDENEKVVKSLQEKGNTSTKEQINKNNLAIVTAVELDKSELGEITDDGSGYVKSSIYGKLIKIGTDNSKYYKPIGVLAANTNSDVKGQGTNQLIRQKANEIKVTTPTGNFIVSDNGTPIKTTVKSLNANLAFDKDNTTSYLDAMENASKEEYDSQVDKLSANDAVVVEVDEGSSLKLGVPNLKNNNEQTFNTTGVIASSQPIGKTPLREMKDGRRKRVEDGSMFLDELKKFKNETDFEKKQKIFERIKGHSSLIEKWIKQVQFVINNDETSIEEKEKGVMNFLSKYIYSPSYHLRILEKDSDNPYIVLVKGATKDAKVEDKINLDSVVKDTDKNIIHLFDFSKGEIDEMGCIELLANLMDFYLPTVKGETFKWQIDYRAIKEKEGQTNNSIVKNLINDGIILFAVENGIPEYKFSTLEFSSPFSKEKQSPKKEEKVLDGGTNPNTNKSTKSDTNTSQGTTLDEDTNIGNGGVPVNTKSSKQSIEEAIQNIKDKMSKSSIKTTTTFENGKPTSYYEDNNGNKTKRVTSLVKEYKQEEFNEDGNPTVPTAVGDSYDAFLRDAFGDESSSWKEEDGLWINKDGEPLYSIYRNMSNSDIINLLKEINAIKKELKNKGYHFDTSGLTITGRVKAKINGKEIDDIYTGTIDMLVYDNNGNPFIIDFKTIGSSSSNALKDKSAGWAVQLLIYRELMRQNGINVPVENLGILPIGVSYDAEQWNVTIDTEGNTIVQSKDNHEETLNETGGCMRYSKGTSPIGKNIFTPEEIKTFSSNNSSFELTSKNMPVGSSITVETPVKTENEEENNNEETKETKETKEETISVEDLSVEDLNSKLNDLNNQESGILEDIENKKQSIQNNNEILKSKKVSETDRWKFNGKAQPITKDFTFEVNDIIEDNDNHYWLIDSIEEGDKIHFIPLKIVNNDSGYYTLVDDTDALKLKSDYIDSVGLSRRTIHLYKNSIHNEYISQEEKNKLDAHSELLNKEISELSEKLKDINNQKEKIKEIIKNKSGIEVNTENTNNKVKYSKETLQVYNAHENTRTGKKLSAALKEIYKKEVSEDFIKSKIEQYMQDNNNEFDSMEDFLDACRDDC